MDDIEDVISIFTHVRLYTSSTETGAYNHLDYIALVAGQSVYYYDHVDGTEDTWYKSSYYNMNSGLESSLSEAVQGVAAELYHYPTYLTEVNFSSFGKNVIRKIRRLTGGLKKLDRLYISSADTELCSMIKEDNRTIELENRGWPVYITLNGEEKTSTSDPIVQGYKWLTFSGTIGEDDYPIDIWSYAFRFSDREIYDAYNDSMIPPGLTVSTVTSDHLVLQTSIDLLESMAAEDTIEDGAKVKDDHTEYDPSAGLRLRGELINRLRKQLEALVKQYMMSNVSGALID
jgi:hypothetical protein